MQGIKLQIKQVSKLAKFGDVRIDNRFATILESLIGRPDMSILTSSSGWAEVLAAYHFFDNQKVTTEKIIDATAAYTIKKIETQRRIFVLNDTTTISLGQRKADVGGYITKNQHPKSKGIFVHSALAVSETGIPEGLIHQIIWHRESDDVPKKHHHSIPIEDKESYVWIDVQAKVQALVPSQIETIVIGDRGSDIFELFAQERRENCHFLIRASQNRKVVKQDELLFELAAKASVVGFEQVIIPRKGSQKERKVSLEIRVAEAVLAPPKRLVAKKQKPIKVTIILAKECASGTLVSNPVEWRLLTSLPVKSLNDARDCVRWYSWRWLIERFHYTLKSGCLVESLQLEESSRMNRAIATFSIVALMLMNVMYTARQNPEESCERFFEKDEWEALFCFLNKTKKPESNPPNLHAAITMIAKLGGFLNRKNDGQPGLKNLWQGIRRLSDITETYKILRTQ
jgi:transposase Tn5 family protein/transposase-like protein